MGVVKSGELEKSNVIYVEVSYTLTQEDIQKIYADLKAKIAHHGSVRVYLEINDFNLSDVGLKAYWTDFKILLQDPHMLKQIQKVALVTDQAWIQNLFELERMILPELIGEMFSPKQKDEALLWLEAEESKSGTSFLQGPHLQWAEVVGLSTAKALGGLGVGLLVSHRLKACQRRFWGLTLISGSVSLGLSLLIHWVRRKQS